jgi:hypothetical protein
VTRHRISIRPPTPSTPGSDTERDRPGALSGLARPVRLTRSSRPRLPAVRPPTPATSSQRAPDSSSALSSRVYQGKRKSLIRIACEAGTSILEETGTFVTSYADKRFTSSVAQRLGVAAYELFSNALSYGTVTQPVVFEMFDTLDGVEIEVSNGAIPARMKMLQTQIGKLKSDPEGTYMDEMRRSLGGGYPRAMLGLARVCHEQRMQLNMVAEDQLVTLTARTAR